MSRCYAWIVAGALCLAGLFAAPPARADDISAAGRGVVRIVTIAVMDDEVVGFGHGSGFAVAPNRIVTNAHVVEAAARYPGNVVIGVVPSEGDKSFQGRLIAVDPERDLALIEFDGPGLPPLTLFTGPPGDGSEAVALGYPGNVDLATARSAADFITPVSPVRTQGNFSGLRTLAGTMVILHTANIARGNSGVPLLDRCGRVLGVNSALTRADDGDAGFGFAVANSELTGFLRGAGQKVATVASTCVGIEEQLAQTRDADARAAAEAIAAERARLSRAASEREAAIEEARASNEEVRENFIAGAAVLLVLGAMAVGGAGLLETRGRRRPAIWSAAGGGVLMIGAVALFLLRPDFDASAAVPEPAEPAPAPVAATPQGRLVCTLQPERSRVTVSTSGDVELDWREDGCVNGRTQYVRAGTGWQRVLVPDEEQTVSVLDFTPASGVYVNTRYLLSAAQMAEARRLRGARDGRQCDGDAGAQSALADSQNAIRAALPPLPNEKLVYACKPAPAGAR